MPKIQNVLVTGGAGFIGSHSVLELLECGYNVIAVDSFVNAVQGNSDADGKAVSLNRVEEITGKRIVFYKLNVIETEKLVEIMKKHDIECVIHFASLKAVGESISNPLEYYQNNIVGALSILKAMKQAGIKKFIFSSSATVYGDPKTLPLDEDHPVGQGLTNPYGQTKYFIEQILMDLCKAEPDWDVVILRYFNPVGAHASGKIGEDPQGLPNNLMPYVSQVAVGKLPFVKVFGNDYDTVDGTGVRDYIHIVDLAKGHVSSVKKIEEGKPGCKVYNLGTGQGYSVLQMIAALEKACGHKIAYEIHPRRPGDLASVYCDPKKALQEMGWKALFGLEQMSKDLWRWQSANPNGFKPKK